MSQSASLPVLDFSRFDADPSQRTDFLAELRMVAREGGFFCLVSHGIDQSVIDILFATSRHFSTLQERENMSAEIVNSPHFRGCSRPGLELTRGRRDWREQIDISAERPTPPIGPDSPPWARLQGPNQ